MPAPPAYSPLSEADLFAWWRPDVVTHSGGTVTAWVDQKNGHVLASASLGPALSSSDANWNGLPSLSFSNHELVFDGAASVWNFLHNGEPMMIIIAHRPTVGNATERIFGTRTASVDSRGILISRLNSQRMQALWSDGSTNNLNAAGANDTAPTNTRTYAVVTRATADSPDAVLYYPPDTSRATGSATPSTGNPAEPLKIGRAPGGTGAPYTGTIAEIIILKTTDAAVRGRIHDYLVARYEAA